MEKETDNSLIGCMREVPDPRTPYNPKHKFLDIIVITITAVLSGMDTWNEIEDRASSKKEWLGQFLELPGGIPSHDTINRVFQRIDPGKFHGAFFWWAGAVAGAVGSKMGGASKRKKCVRFALDKIKTA